MSLSTRELLLILRARDDMSNVLARSGTAMTTLAGQTVDANAKLLGTGLALTAVGTGLREAGLGVLRFGADAVNTFKDVQQEAAIIATQAQNLGLSSQEILKIVNDVGGQYGTSLGGLRESLFEILSTVETDVPGAITILENLALAGVASGDSSARFAGVATAALNAFGLEAEDSLRVLDAIFRAVEQGQGSYENFAAGFATAIPSAQAFNQTMEDTFAAVAFVTKATGLSESEAGTAVARAFDLFARTDNIANLERYGVSVVDLEGNFRDVVDILGDMEKAFGGLSEFEQRSALEDIFGEGNVRAFRFLNPVINDFEAFKAVIGEVNQGIQEGSGILGAYNLVGSEAETSFRQLVNLFEIFKQEVGQALLPIFNELVTIATQLLGAWNSLDPELRQMIIQFTAIAAVVAVVVGTFATIVGAILTMQAVFGFLGITFGSVVAIGGAVLLAFAAIAGAAILIVKNWEQVKSIVGPILDRIKAKFEEFWNALTTGFTEDEGTPLEFLAIRLREAWIKITGVLDWAKGAWDQFWSTFSGAHGKEVGPNGMDGIVSTFELIGMRVREVWDFMQPILVEFRDGLAQFFDTLVSGYTSDSASGFVGFMQRFAEIVRETWSVVKNVFTQIKDGIDEFVTVLLGGTLKGDLMGGPFGNGENSFVSLMGKLALFIREVAIPAVVAIAEAFGKFIGWARENLIPAVVEIASAFIDGIGGILVEIAPTLEAIITLTQGFILRVTEEWKKIWPFIEPILGLLMDGIAIAWDFMGTYIASAMTIISNVIQMVMNVIQGDWQGAWDNIKAILGAAWALIRATFSAGIAVVKAVVVAFFGFLKAQFNAIKAFLVRIGQSMIDGFRNAALRAWSKVTSWFGSLKGKIKGIFSGAYSWLQVAGRNILNGLWRGLKDKWSSVKAWVSDLGGQIVNLKGPPEKDKTLLVNNGKLIMNGLEKGLRAGWSDTSRFLDGLNNDRQFGIQGVYAPTDNSSMMMNQMMGRMAGMMENMAANAGIHVDGDLNVGSMGDVDDLDYWTRTSISGVQ